MDELAALAATKTQVLEQLIALQTAYNLNVEDESAGQSDLSHYSEQLAGLQGALAGIGASENEGNSVLNSQL